MVIQYSVLTEKERGEDVFCMAQVNVRKDSWMVGWRTTTEDWSYYAGVTELLMITNGDIQNWVNKL